MFDLLIKNGRVDDGTGLTWFRVSLGIAGDTVTVVRGDTSSVEAPRAIDAADRVVCPGFTDMHSHSDLKLLNGKLVIDDGVHTGATPSRALGSQ